MWLIKLNRHLVDEIMIYFRNYFKLIQKSMQIRI